MAKPEESTTPPGKPQTPKYPAKKTVPPKTTPKPGKK